MFPTTNSEIEIIKSSPLQKVTIAFNGTAQSTTITESDIVTGGLSINRYCASTNKIEIGSAIAAEMNLVLRNDNGKFNDVTFEGAELFVQLSIPNGSTSIPVSLGYFTIDNAPRKLTTLTISALDRMVQFDKNVQEGDITFPITVSSLLSRICTVCNVPLYTTASSLPNANYSIPAMPSGTYTYREYLSWICEITGTCAFIDWNGQLRLQWYKDTGVTITEKDRYSSDLLEKPITITGVQIETTDTTYISGEEGYVLNIQSNGLIQGEYESIVANIGAALTGFTYTPFSASTRPMPSLWPMDIITFSRNGTESKTIITDCTFTISSSTELAGKGESETANGYASANPLTKRETAIIQAMQKKQENTDNSALQAAIDFNNLISNSLGLFVTDVSQSNGSTIRYLHDKTNLSESTTIFTMTANGIAWTNQGWNDGNPIWEYGTTGAGDAFFRIVRAIMVSAGRIESTDGKSVVFDLDNSELSINCDDGSYIRLKRYAGYSALEIALAELTLTSGKTLTEELESVSQKCRVFTEQPVPPYNKGDLWINGTDIMVSTVTHPVGNFTDWHWEKKDSYTTEETVNTKIQVSETAIKESVSSDVKKIVSDEMGAYVLTSNLDSEISQIIENDTAQINIALAGKFVTQEALSDADYLKSIDLNAGIETYIDGTTGTAKIISAVSGEYATKTELGETKTELTSSILQSVSESQASILAEVSATYAKDSDVKASLELKVSADDNDQIISMINASSDVINLSANRISISSDNFSLSPEGVIYATSGTLGGWSMDQYFLSADQNTFGLYSGDEYKLQSFVDESATSPVRFFRGTIDAENTQIKNPTFYVLADGSLYSTAAKFFGQKVVIDNVTMDNVNLNNSTLGEDVIVGKDGMTLGELVEKVNGNTDIPGDVTNDSFGEADGDTMRYTIDCEYLAINKNLIIGDLTVEAQNSYVTDRFQRTRFPITISNSVKHIIRISIKCNAGCELTADYGYISSTDGVTWTWEGDVNSVTIYSNKNSIYIDNTNGDGLIVTTY